MKYCPNCRAANHNKSYLCFNCSTMLPKRISIFNVILGIIGFFIAISFLSYLVKERDHASSNDLISSGVSEASKPKLELIESTMTNDGFVSYVTGKVKNNSGKEYKYLQIEFAVYDKDGNLIGTAWDNITNFAPEKTWVFNAAVLKSGAVGYELKAITGW